MNKKEITEVRRKFFAESDTLVMNHVLTVVVNPNHETQKVRYKNIAFAAVIDDYERSIYYNTLKKILSTKLGKKLVEYRFPNSAYEDGKSQSVLYNITQSAFVNEEDTENFVNQIVENFKSDVPYAIIAAHCTYTVFKKNKADECDKYSSEEYKFIITAICPIKHSDGTLAYNFSKDEFINSVDNKLSISRIPSDGFLFPAFNDRSSDINSVMYYTKSPKNPNLSMVEDVLGCTFMLSPLQESESYKTLLKDISGDNLSYELIIAMEKEIQAFIDANKNSTEPPLLNKRELYNMLSRSFNQLDIDEDRLDAFDAMYNHIVGMNIPLTATNLIDSKILIEVAGASLSVQNPVVCDVEPVSIDGVLTTRITVNIADSTFNINGMSIKK